MVLKIRAVDQGQEHSKEADFKSLLKEKHLQQPLKRGTEGAKDKQIIIIIPFKLAYTSHHYSRFLLLPSSLLPSSLIQANFHWDFKPAVWPEAEILSFSLDPRTEQNITYKQDAGGTCGVMN